MSEDAVAAESPKRGRPRSADTLERDNVVLAAIPEDGTAITRKALAESTGQEESAIYLSLYRLKRDGHVVGARENGAHVWKRTPADAA